MDVSEEHTFQGTFYWCPPSSEVWTEYFFTINYFVPISEIEQFYYWEEKPPECGHSDIKAQCSSFASSMGHHFLPWCGDTQAVCAVATLSLRWWPQLFFEHLQDFVAPCSSAMCSKRLPDAPSSMWGWHAVGMGSKGCIASARLLGSSGEVSGKKSII